MRHFEKFVHDWKRELFLLCNDWFFRMLRMGRLGVEEGAPDGESNPTEYDPEPNPEQKDVSAAFIELLDQLFRDDDMKVYDLRTDPETEDEFAWRQYFFVRDKSIFILSFYQWG